MKLIQGFKDFILRGNVVDMAVGIVIGASFGTVVSALVKDLMTPLVAAIFKAPDFSALSFTINGSVFKYGEFLNALIAFLIAAVAVYFFVVTPLNLLVSKIKSKQPEAPAPTTKQCPECLSDIPLAAKRCAHCTQPVG